MTEKHDLLSNLADWTGLSNHSQVTVKKRTDTRGGNDVWSGVYSQSRCFFFGPLTSCVVALHTALLIADPVMLCWAAVIRSVIDWPDIAPTFFLSPPSISENSTITIRSMDQLNVTSLSSGGNREQGSHTHAHTQTHTVFHTTCAAMSAHYRYKNNPFNYNLNLKIKQKKCLATVCSVYLSKQ